MDGFCNLTTSYDTLSRFDNILGLANTYFFKTRLKIEDFKNTESLVLNMALDKAIIQAAPEMIEGVQPLIDLVQPFFIKASIVVGGIFGIYLLLLLVRVHYERKKVKILQDIRYDLDNLNMHYGLKNSKHKRNFLRRFIGFFKRKSREKAVARESSLQEEVPAEKKEKKTKK